MQQPPFPLTLTVPAGWTPLAGDEVAFAAGLPLPGDPFSPTITLGAWPAAPDAPDADLAPSADAAVRTLEAETGRPVAVGARTTGGEAGVATLSQVLTLVADTPKGPLELRQTQLFLHLPDPADTTRHAVVELALTCMPTQLDRAFPAFRALAASLHPEL